MNSRSIRDGLLAAPGFRRSCQSCRARGRSIASFLQSRTTAQQVSDRVRILESGLVPGRLAEVGPIISKQPRRLKPGDCSSS